VISVRHTNQLVGGLVLVAIGVMLFAALQAGVLRDWFRATSELRLIFPATGVAGMEVGADVEILGTKAGVVRRIVIDPNQQMYALIEIDEQAKAFIRRDSKAVIRRRFGVAGAAFVDISRGAGEELDWSFAVIEATTERAPTDSVSALIDEARQKIFPILDNVGAITASMAEIVDRINRGQGTIGRLMADQTLLQQVEDTVTQARNAVVAVNALIAELQKSAGNVTTLTQEAAGPEGVPAVLARAEAALAAAKGVIDDLAIASQRVPAIAQNIDESAASLPNIARSVESGTANFPAIAKNIEGTTANLPALLTQLQVTIKQLDQLLAQIRRSWLLGGGNVQPQEPRQFSPSQVLP